MDKIYDFSLETMKEISSDFFNMLEEYLQENDSIYNVVAKGQKDYLEIDITNGEKYKCSISIKYYILYNYFLAKVLDAKAITVGDLILDSEWVEEQSLTTMLGPVEIKTETDSIIKELE